MIRIACGFILTLILLLASFVPMAGGAAAQPPEEEDLVFAVFGDSRIALPGAPVPIGYQRILQEVNWIRPDLAIHTGDLIYGYLESEAEIAHEYDEAFGALRRLEVPRYVVPGNHDFQTEFTRQEFARLADQPQPYFSFMHKGAMFVILNTDIPGQLGDVAAEQRAWLEEQLRKGTQARAVFVFMHRPLFSPVNPEVINDGIPEPEFNFASREKRDSLADLLVEYGVTAVFAGHEHLYYRTTYRGIPFITVGGGGAPMELPPDKGGFLSYMLVTVSGSGLKTELLEPYQIDLQYATPSHGDAATVLGRALVSNTAWRGYRLPLQGIKFTVPKGKYSLQVDTIPAPERIQAIAKEMAAPWPEDINAALDPAIYRVEESHSDPTRNEVWVRVFSTGGVPLRITLLRAD